MFLFGNLLPNGGFYFFKMEEKGCWVFSGKISHFLKKNKSRFYIKFQNLDKNIERALNCFYFHFFINIQIWLNILMDDHNFTNFTKLKERKKKVV
jgi:hypothetical protein